METKKTSVMYRMIKGTVRFFYPKMQVEGAENLPDAPVIVVSNHCPLPASYISRANAIPGAQGR